MLKAPGPTRTAISRSVFSAVMGSRSKIMTHYSHFSLAQQDVSGKGEFISVTVYNTLVTNWRSMAYSELRLILARVIFNFDLALPDDPEDDRGDWLDQKVFTVWEKGPLKVSVTPVQYGKAAGSGKTQ